jgi:hypothetical protein
VSVFRSRLGVAIAIIDDQILAEFPLTELHLHRSNRIFGGEGDGDMPAVSRPLRGRGCTPGGHDHRAELLLCAQGRGRECELAGIQWSETSTVHAGRRGSLRRVAISPVGGTLLVC